MPCYHPIDAYLGANGVFFTQLARNGDCVEIKLPCGQCVGCRLERSRKWAMRCMHESSLYDNNAFLTLTYSPDNLPADMSLNYRHFQLFMKRLRKKFGDKVRFYMCGEYGDKYGRPHYHAIMFNLDIPDKLYYGDSKGTPIYTSEIIDRLWTFGQCWIGDVTFESAAYVARYVMKKITGDAAVEHYKYVDPDGVVHSIVPEFCQMSRRPGIGAPWLEKFQTDVFPNDYVVVRGVKCKPPRFYDKIFKRVDEHEFNLIKSDRVKDSRKDNSARRLADKEKCAILRVERFARDIT